MAKHFWLTFHDETKPKKKQFLGGCWVTITAQQAQAEKAELPMQSHADAPWVAAAARMAHQQGCNPGGSVAVLEVSSRAIREGFFKYKNRNQLYSPAEIDAIERRITKELRREEVC